MPATRLKVVVNYARSARLPHSLDPHVLSAVFRDLDKRNTFAWCNISKLQITRLSANGQLRKKNDQFTKSKRTIPRDKCMPIPRSSSSRVGSLFCAIAATLSVTTSAWYPPTRAVFWLVVAATSPAANTRGNRLSAIWRVRLTATNPSGDNDAGESVCSGPDNGT